MSTRGHSSQLDTVLVATSSEPFGALGGLKRFRFNPSNSFIQFDRRNGFRRIEKLDLATIQISENVSADYRQRTNARHRFWLSPRIDKARPD